MKQLRASRLVGAFPLRHGFDELGLGGGLLIVLRSVPDRFIAVVLGMIFSGFGAVAERVL